MTNEEGKTTILPNLEQQMEESLIKQTIRENTGLLVDKREIIIKIDDSEEHITLSGELHCLLGRFGKKQPGKIAVNLTPYGARELGISRIHAQLHVDGQRLYITDLDSSNGTYLRGERVRPHMAAEVQDGDEVFLGKLKLIIEIH